MNNHPQRVAKLLLANRGELSSNFWGWLKSNRLVSKKDANKFFLASILDYQMRTHIAWENARRLAEDVLGDPDNLWEAIISVSLEEWIEKRDVYSLHRFPNGHERVWTIGERIVKSYQGDVRTIWCEQAADVVLNRLNKLGVGEQLSRMVVGALMDTGQISGKGDVKVDTHVQRVLGRALRGHSFSSQDIDTVIVLTREMNPDNPWLLDRPLYTLGKQICKANDRACASCFLQPECTYYNNSTLADS